MAILDFLKPKPKTPYQRLGGEKGVRELVTHFYEIMDHDPNAAAVRATHGESLETAASKLFDFLSGWLGGPPLFETKYGHPRLRMRHFPFAIGPQERDEWLYCMDQAMKKMHLEADLHQQMTEAFAGLAERIRNKD
ncbi:MAG: group II truncated hemoglobin [Bacteriovoracaceae bacterium]|nr:group II truncated hemoglobin [Bacteriovoracaceae bacterium]